MNKRTICIVDDVPDNLRLLFDALRNTEFRVLVETNSIAALDTIGEVKPDLILLDIKMPEMDGFEVCSRLKADPATRDIPVLFMTALTDVVSEAKGLQLGAVDYITKPLRIDAALARIRRQLELSDLHDALARENQQLQHTVQHVKMLAGWLEICANCKKIKDEERQWVQLEKYIEARSETMFSHGICPYCMERLYGEQKWFQNLKAAGKL